MSLTSLLVGTLFVTPIFAVLPTLSVAVFFSTPTASGAAPGSLKEDLESRGPVRLSEVEAQQKEILKTVKRLADEGTIVVSSGGADALV